MLPPRALIITLDDGYKENYHLLELMKKTGIVPTVFLCSDMPDTNKDYWFRLVGNRKISNNLKKVSNKDRLTILKDFKPEAASQVRDRVVLNRKEIGEMLPYSDFQSHTQSHPVLTRCTDSEVVEEVAGSKKVLKEKFGLEIYALAYPNGSFGDREMNILKEQGYLCGLGLNYGLNTILTNPYSLSRVPVNDNAGINEIIVKSAGIYDFFVKWLFPVKKYI
ncbi:MAG: polysaccharide deacetylase family protein [Bacteroidales bacterium]|nr:polysaccharide deacetylase family protein [Bacteroidales bacterium]